MILVTINKLRQLVVLTYIGEVRAEELVRARPDLISFLAELSPGFRLLTDLSHLHTIEKDCIEQISQAMEACHQRGVGLVVRVIPDPTKDIGMNILSAFHYPHHQRIVTCASMLEAARVLGL